MRTSFSISPKSPYSPLIFYWAIYNTIHQNSLLLYHLYSINILYSFIRISRLYVSPQSHQRWSWIQKSFKCSPSCVLYIRAADRDYFLVGDSRSVNWFMQLISAGLTTCILLHNVKSPYNTCHTGDRHKGIYFHYSIVLGIWTSNLKFKRNLNQTKIVVNHLWYLTIYLFFLALSSIDFP